VKCFEIKYNSSDGRKFISQYGHLKSMLVSVGDTGYCGETVIGIMGLAPELKWIHLHFNFGKNIKWKSLY
jgi:murein DD-endopeptidase MepM/ murein hydrolase activator NlpD